MSTIVLSASKRAPGRSTARTLRTEGHVPGVYYANGAEPVHFSVPALNLRNVVYTAAAKLVRLEVEGHPAMDCVLKDVTFDPVTDKILHLDFHGVKPGEQVILEMAIHLTGSAEGIKFGGVVDHVLHRTKVRVAPHEMPEQINVDISNLNVGSALHVKDIDIPGLQILNRPDAIVVTCLAPKVKGA